MLSPEERKHYKKRKDYVQMDTEEMNAYNVIQDAYTGRENEDIMSSSIKKIKSRKKRHGDTEMGMGDSREMMIPKEKKKSRKKKRESSPANSNSNKRKHKKRDDDYELRNDIAAALDELQDDVFDNIEDHTMRSERVRKSPRKSDKIYVQKKNKFEAIPRPSSHLNRQIAQDIEESKSDKRFTTYPLEIALIYQRWWIRFSNLCHGLLGGLALGHALYILSNLYQQDTNFLVHYAYYSDTYVGLYFGLCVLCIVSVFDRIDLAHFDKHFLRELWKQKLNSSVAVLYITCLFVHLSTANYDDKLSLMSYKNSTFLTNITKNDLYTWNHLSLWRSTLAFTAWIFLGLGPSDDMLHQHLKNMEVFLPDK